MTRPLFMRWPFLALPMAGLLAGLFSQTPASANNEIGDLLGTWSGWGQIVLKSGVAEKIKCNAYNTGGGNELRLVVRCASTSYKIEIRSRLEKKGSALSGEWEERTYNATGTASGKISANSVTLSITGGGFSGRMNVTYSPTRQTIGIQTDGIDMKSVDIGLSRSQ